MTYEEDNRTDEHTAVHRAVCGTAGLGDGAADGAARHALSLDGTTLRSTWEEGDKVYVYADATSTEPIGTLLPQQYGVKSTTLSGNIDAEGLVSGETRLYFSTQPRASHTFAQQDGTLDGLFYATSSGVVTIDGGNASLEMTKFANPQAILKCTLRTADGTTPVTARSLVVTGGADIINVTIADPGQSEVFIAFPPTDVNVTYTFTAVDGEGNIYEASKTATLQGGKYYYTTLKMSKQAARVTTAPVGKTGLTYTGSAQELLESAGTASGGEMQYCLTEDGTFSAEAPTATAAGTYTVYYKVAGDANHSDSEVAGPVNVTIEQKEVVVSGIKANDKEYDGTTAATFDYSGAVFTGKVDGDELTVTATGAFEDAKIAKGLTVYITNLTLGGASADNYKLAAAGQQTTTIASIIKPDLGVALSDASVKPGWVVASNNKAYSDAAGIPDGVDAIAMVCYVGEAGTADASSTTYRGLAIALQDAKDHFNQASTKMIWCPAIYYSSYCLPTHYSTTALSLTDMDGIANTAYLKLAIHIYHYAAWAANEYESTVASPEGTSGWFLPTMGQWDKMLTGLFGGVGLVGGQNDDYDAGRINDKFKAAGLGTTTGAPALHVDHDYYWTSTECSERGAWVYLTSGYLGGGQADAKYTDSEYYVRAVFAF